MLIADTCLCEYTSHGHCGIPGPDDQPGFIENDRSLDLLTRAAVAQAEAGADIVAPSDMLDGRVQAIRSALDGRGLGDLCQALSRWLVPDAPPLGASVPFTAPLCTQIEEAWRYRAAGHLDQARDMLAKLVRS